MASRRQVKITNNKKKRKDNQWDPFRRDVPQIEYGPLWRINRTGRDTVVAGRGLVANANIPRGKLILTDEPILVLETETDDSMAFYQSERAGDTRIIATAVDGLEAGKRTILRNLHGNDDIQICEWNAWGFSDPWLGPNNWKVVGRYLSRINHSCMPNTVVSDVCVDGNPEDESSMGAMRLIASRDIKAGEELFVEYVKDDEFWLQPRATRQAYLQLHWDFTCTCSACSDDTFQTADQGFADLRALRGRISNPLPIPYDQNQDAYARRRKGLEDYATSLFNLGYTDCRLAEVWVT